MLHLLMPMSIIPSPITALISIKLNQRINPHNRHASLHRTLQLLDLTHTGLQHARLHTIVHTSLIEIEPVVAVPFRLGKRLRVRTVRGVRALGDRSGRAIRSLASVSRRLVAGCAVAFGRRGLGGALAEGVAGAQLGDEFGGVFGGVDGEGGGDGEEGGGEGADG